MAFRVRKINRPTRRGNRFRPGEFRVLRRSAISLVPGDARTPDMLVLTRLGIDAIHRIPLAQHQIKSAVRCQRDGARAIYRSPVDRRAVGRWLALARAEPRLDLA